MNEENVRRFCDAATEIILFDPVKQGTVCYSANFFVQTTLPHRDPGMVESWGRSNGRRSLVLQPGVISNQDGVTTSIGLPYGNIPRLLIQWITTEAKKYNQREMDLEQSLAGFMRKIGLVYATGGKNGSICRFKDQLTRLLSMSIFASEGWPCAQQDGTVSGSRIQIAESYHLNWEPKKTKGERSYLVLDQNFFNRILERPIPVDLRALRLLKSSPLALDLYTWLTYRTSYLAKKTLIPWRGLMKQLGAEYAKTPQGVQGFKRAVIGALNKINIFWDVKIEIEKNAIVLYPQNPHIKKTPQFKKSREAHQKELYL